MKLDMLVILLAIMILLVLGIAQRGCQTSEIVAAIEQCRQSNRGER
jgi:hypothetical protein